MNNTLSPRPLTTVVCFFLGILPAYLSASYFSTIYTRDVSFALTSFLTHIFYSTLMVLFLEAGLFQVRLQDHWNSLLILLVTAGMPVSAILISLQYPALFDSSILFMNTARLPVFFAMAVAALIVTLVLNTRIHVLDIFKNSLLYQFIQKNRAGLLLSSFFLICYSVLTQSLNFPEYYTRDYFFEADISDWIANFTTMPTPEMKAIRAVHPAVMLILKPLAALLSIPLNGNQLQAILFLNALAGATGVFLVWSIIKQRTGNTAYALTAAALLGASTSHLLFSSMLETYIFSSLALIGFCAILQNGKTSLRWTIPAGVVVFGITITNLAQVCILYFLESPRIKTIIKFITAVLLITLVLNFIQTQWYANAQPLTPVNLTNEQKYKSKIFVTDWQTKGQINLLVRSILLYDVLAPQPYILTEEVGTIAPSFRTFRVGWDVIYVAGYKGFADLVVKFWMVILLLAIARFFLDLIRAPRKMTFPLALALCLVFNFSMHLFYGDDPMLYSPNWTYALILLITISLEKWADNKWLQSGLTLLLAAMVYINMSLINQILEATLPFYGK